MILQQRAGLWVSAEKKMPRETMRNFQVNAIIAASSWEICQVRRAKPGAEILAGAVRAVQPQRSEAAAGGSIATASGPAASFPATSPVESSSTDLSQTPCGPR